jgi:putative YhdH/YhfP family quinone oxidoreductase
MMNNTSYQAFRVEQAEERSFKRSIQTLHLDDLPQGDVLIRVRYSSLNYKDALSATGNKGVTRSYPHTPGIDAAGTVELCETDRFKPGQEVIVTSYDLGMNTSGGFGQYIRVPAEWVVPLPQGLSLRQSMIFGTAGFTAGMSVEKLIKRVLPDSGEILVTGATGGVGSMAAAIMSHLGYKVIGVSGKKDTQFLENLGVREVLSRDAILEGAGAPLLKTRWAGVIDTVGGDILAAAIKSAALDGIVTCCGNVASPDLPINVFPFILRGISLMGIDSQHCPMPLRSSIWDRLAGEWKFDRLEDTAKEIGLDQLNDNIDAILKGRLQGRTIVNLE